MKKLEQVKNIPTLVKDASLVEKRRRQIVEAAMKLFVQKGFHPTTTREIARMAGFSIGTLYEYIGSKEDVLYLVCEAIHSEMETKLRQALDEGSTGRETLVNAISNYFQVCDRMQDSILLIYQESSSLDRDALRYVLASDERVTSTFANILLQGLKDGTLHLEKNNVKLIAHNIIVLGHMWTFRRWFLRRAFGLEEYIRIQTSFLLSELTGKG
ncbi:MAG: TetR/AcrR family transcriptional regulator [Deltaproteobacteria bacterium]|nr:TetR/AcrR family transcriptional regulator [Deltaproteobacteria bacterium]MBW2086137.1 TetR/AcrR family transcriptional regulator [Deltaproteobacteria bacterium]